MAVNMVEKSSPFFKGGTEWVKHSNKENLIVFMTAMR